MTAAVDHLRQPVRSHRQQYQDALDRHLGDVALAGPAADALREHRLDPEAVSWLQTNFLKTELELGHWPAHTRRGPVRMRPRAHLLQVPHHQRLCPAITATPRHRGTSDRGRSRPRLGPRGRTTPRHPAAALRDPGRSERWMRCRPTPIVTSSTGRAGWDFDAQGALVGRVRDSRLRSWLHQRSIQHTVTDETASIVALS